MEEKMPFLTAKERKNSAKPKNAVRNSKRELKKMKRLSFPIFLDKNNTIKLPINTKKES